MIVAKKARSPIEPFGPAPHKLRTTCTDQDDRCSAARVDHLNDGRPQPDHRARRRRVPHGHRPSFRAQMRSRMPHGVRSGSARIAGMPFQANPGHSQEKRREHELADGTLTLTPTFTLNLSLKLRASTSVTWRIRAPEDSEPDRYGAPAMPTYLPHAVSLYLVARGVRPPFAGGRARLGPRSSTPGFGRETQAPRRKEPRPRSQWRNGKTSSTRSEFDSCVVPPPVRSLSRPFPRLGRDDLGTGGNGTRSARSLQLTEVGSKERTSSLLEVSTCSQLRGCRELHSRGQNHVPFPY